MDAFYASGMPVRHPGFDAVISMRFGPEESGAKTVGLGVTDHEGSLIAPARYEVIHVELTPGQIYLNKTLKVTVAETEFPAFGDYLVVWLLEGLEVHNVPLKVRRKLFSSLKRGRPLRTCELQADQFPPLHSVFVQFPHRLLPVLVLNTEG